MTLPTSKPAIRIRHVEDFRFLVDFGPPLAELAVDEAPPIGGGEGPFPEQLLLASVANCLVASMVFALGKFRQNPRGVSAEARCELGRNAEGRLRIQAIEVLISLDAEASEMDRIDRVLEQFERFCTVSESVKRGVPVSVTVRDGAGRQLR
ncbi:OsmC family protein [Chelatococcus sambhunathii]|uniref:OsmC family protein n=1 Tax=Chelatococcus sambhunathii TaxID=363953 RepID=A0ABU1DA94_9HYPH|nr:OsmC family protein [Chelatococcus sambhunathii]MDR4305037.1 OsmC family protein [Chelatococcus sambhunathii]